MRCAGRRLSLLLGTTVLGAGLLAAATVLPAQAAGPRLDVTATVDGHSLKGAGSNSPVVLRPNDSTIVSVTVTNNGTSSVDVRAVRLDARVLGLAFFSYTTRVDLTLAPGATGKRQFALDLGDLDGQATGLLPAELSLLSPNRTVLASESGTVDVKGKLLSVYGVFGLAVAAITALLLLTLIGRLLRRSLPSSRWARAVRFAVPGVGLGLTVTFSLGLLRITVPSLGTSVGLLLGGLVVGFILGYLTPDPTDEADRDELDERDVVAAPPLSPASHSGPAATAPVATVPATPPPPLQPAGPRVTAPVAGAPAAPAEPVRPAAPPYSPQGDDGRQTRQAGPPAPPPA